MKDFFDRNSRFLFARWQVVRRNQTFVDFCDKHSDKFSDIGVLNTEAHGVILDEVEEIRDRFGLNLIYHYNTRIPDRDIVESLVFKEPHAIRTTYCYRNMETDGVDGPGPYDDDLPIEISPSVERNSKILLEVDISGNIPEGQLQDEFREAIRHARLIAGIEKKLSIPSETDFKIYDLKQQYKGEGRERYHKEIIKKVWPVEYQEAADDVKAGQKYSELLKEYRKNGISDYQERAYSEAYGNSLKHLYQRVADRLSAVEKWIDKCEKGC